VIRTASILKPKIDRLTYRGLILKNNLRCVLVSDPSTTISSASMNVHIGSLLDPKEYQGLAHFLEHMLFLGTEKYPVESTYKKLITDNGGSCNAYTSLLDTNYYYQVKSRKMFDVLDVFAQFFISPLFTEDCTRREINAVDSEAQKNLIIDGRRIHQLSRHLADPDAIYNKFSTGNLKTLDKPGLRQALIDFHRQHYSADVMSLVVYHSESIDSMQQKIEEIFSGVPNKQRSPVTFATEKQQYSKDRRSKLIKLIPVNDKHSMKVKYLLPETHSSRYDKPLSYFSHILGHECRGSIADTLIEENLALAVSCGYSRTADLFTTLELNITLTEKGIRDYSKVLEVVGCYLKFLRSTDPAQWIHRELKVISDINFEFKSKQSPSDMTVDMSSTLAECELEEVLKYDYHMGQFNSSFVKSIQDSLTADNCIVYLSSKSLDLGSDVEHEPHYGTSFKSSNLSPLETDLLNGQTPSKYSPSFRLPSPNRYIPNNLQLLRETSPSAKKPEQILKRVEGDLWYRFDESFELPKAVLNVAVFDNTFNHFTDPLQRIYYSLWCAVFSFIFRPTKYEFTLASAHSSLSNSRKGISFSISSFTDSFPATLQGLLANLEHMNTYSNREQFGEILSKFKMSYRNQLRDQPYETALEHLNEVLIDNSVDLQQTLDFLDQVTWQKFIQFRDQIFRDRIGFSVLLEGNMKQQAAEEAFESIVAAFARNYKPRDWMKQEEIPEPKIKQLDLTRKYIVSQTCYLESEKNSAFVLYHQAGQNKSLRAVYTFLANYLKFKYFYELRTKQQLGYIVAAGSTKLQNVYGFRFIVQSHVADPVHCSRMTREFLSSLRQAVAQITDKEMQDIKQGLIANLEKPADNLIEQSSFDLSEISDRTYEFDRQQKMIREVSSLAKTDIIEAFDKIFFTDQRVLESHVVSRQASENYRAALSSLADEHSEIRVASKPAQVRHKLVNHGEFRQML